MGGLVEREQGPRPGAASPAQGARSPVVDAVVALAVAAGVIHAVAMITHFGEWWAYGVFFLVVVFGQIGWAAWLYRHPHDRRALIWGAVANVAVVSLWLLSRTTGLPFGPDAGRPESVGGMDVMASLDQIMIAVLVVAIVAPSSRIGTRVAWLTRVHLIRLRSMFFSASVFAILVLSSHH